MEMAIINVRLKEEEKREFEKLCNNLGMNMSTAISIFVKTMLRDRGLPFEVSEKKPNLDTLIAMKEAEDMLNGKIKRPSYKRAKEAFEAILGDEY